MAAAERVAVILPNRLGDAILTLPLILCLKALSSAGPPVKIEPYCGIDLRRLFSAVGVDDLNLFDNRAKAASWLSPPDKAFFLVPTFKNFGFRAKASYGLRQRNKFLVRYTHDLPCLKLGVAGELSSFLETECRLPRYSIDQFGVAEALGFGVADLRAHFSFSRESLPVRLPEGASGIPDFGSRFAVCCTEAAYCRGQRNAHRRWSVDHLLALARRLWDELGCRTAFVGLHHEPKIPPCDGFVDLRGKLTILQLFRLMMDAECYYGNDTGPLHVANLAGTPSVGIYCGANFHAPLFGEINTVVRSPAGPDDVFPAIQKVLAAGSLSPGADR